jgi:hypothetical protein
VSKVKPILRLYHQFATFLHSPRLDAYQISDALEVAGLIEVVAHEAAPSGEPLPTHYRETAAFRTLKPDLFRVTLQTALKRGSPNIRPAFVPLEDVRCIDLTEYSATMRAGDLELAERRELGLKRHQLDERIEVRGDIQTIGRSPTVRLQVGSPLTVFAGDRSINITTKRFDRGTIAEELHESFNYAQFAQETEK